MENNFNFIIIFEYIIEFLLEKYGNNEIFEKMFQKIENFIENGHFIENEKQDREWEFL